MVQLPIPAVVSAKPSSIAAVSQSSFVVIHSQISAFGAPVIEVMELNELIQL